MKTIALLLIVHILTGAISEGLYDRGKTKPWRVFGLNFTLILSKLIQVGFIAGLLWYFGFREWALFYICARIAIFNWVNMLAAGRKQPIGNTDIFDLIISLVTFGSVWMYIALCAICAFIAYEMIFPL